MGTWGAGNFDDDTAAEHLGMLTDELIDELKETFAEGDRNIEPDEYGGVLVPCNVELLCLLHKQRWVGATLPDTKTIAAWKKAYLRVWDACIDKLDPKPAFKKARRAKLVATFDELASLARKEEGDVPATRSTKTAAKKPTKRPAAKTPAKKKR